MKMIMNDNNLLTSIITRLDYIFHFSDLSVFILILIAISCTINVLIELCNQYTEYRVIQDACIKII